MALLRSGLLSSGHLARDGKGQTYASCQKAHSGRLVSFLRCFCGLLSHGNLEKELLAESPRMNDYVLGGSSAKGSPDPEESLERR